MLVTQAGPVAEQVWLPHGAILGRAEAIQKKGIYRAGEHAGSRVDIGIDQRQANSVSDPQRVHAVSRQWISGEDRGRHLCQVPVRQRRLRRANSAVSSRRGAQRLVQVCQV